MNQDTQPPRPSPPPPAIIQECPIPPLQKQSPIAMYPTMGCSPMVLRSPSPWSGSDSPGPSCYETVTSPLLVPDEPSLIPGTIELESIKDSKITGVCIYSSQAEVTRLFNVSVKAGLNQLLVRGLPQAMDQDCFRVEGRGAATMHDVVLSYVCRPPPVQVSSETLEKLRLLKERVKNTAERTKQSIQANEVYLASVSCHHLSINELSSIVEAHKSAVAKLHDRIIDLEVQRKAIEEQIEAEIRKLRLEKGTYDERLSMKASITVFADFEGEIEIVLIYVVKNASWSAGYDIKADMQDIGKPIQLAYKGTITQNTGEDWNDVPLTLEAANPTFGLAVPTLDRWALSVKRPTVYTPSARYPLDKSATPCPLGMSGQSMTTIPSAPMIVQHRGADVSSQGAVSATFSVPGLISIPSDYYSHNVTITALLLESTMSWLCVPKKDTTTHLKAKIKNASEYTLLAGSANVYVDGSFIAKTDVPLGSPEETFDCPLGLDPSVRITYHPLSKKVSKSRFYSKSTDYVFKQRITIFNTKTHAIEGFKVLDHFPVSEDSNITVKYINPALVVPSTESTGAGSVNRSTSSKSLNVKGVTPVKISKAVVAQWDGADEVESGDVPIDALGKDGKLEWVCSIPAGSKLSLVLNWEVTAPVGTDVAGF